VRHGLVCTADARRIDFLTNSRPGLDTVFRMVARHVFGASLDPRCLVAAAVFVTAVLQQIFAIEKGGGSQELPFAGSGDFIGFQELLDVAPEVLVARTSTVEVRSPFRGSQIEGALQHEPDSRPAFRSHRHQDAAP
jgi:hypothetical protein